MTRIDGNQALKVIGWGTDAKTQYWIVENSFGEEWGRNGLASIKIGVEDSQLDKVGVVAVVKVDDEEATD